MTEASPKIQWGRLAILFAVVVFWVACGKLAFTIGDAIGERNARSRAEAVFEEQVRATCPYLLQSGLDMTNDECIEIFLDVEGDT